MRLARRGLACSRQGGGAQGLVDETRPRGAVGTGARGKTLSLLPDKHPRARGGGERQGCIGRGGQKGSRPSLTAGRIFPSAYARSA